MRVQADRAHARAAWTLIGAWALLAVVVMSVRDPRVQVALAASGLMVAVVAAAYGVWRHLPSPRLRWSLFGCVLATGVARSLLELVDRVDPGWQVAVATASVTLSITGYTAAAVFAALCVRNIARHAGAVLWFDAGLVSLSLLLVGWSLSVPTGEVAGMTTQTAIQLVYIALDTFLIGLLLQIARQPVGRMPAFWFGFGGLSLVLVGDVLWLVSVSGNGDVPGRFIELAGLAGFFGLAAMALHPSARSLPSAAAMRPRDASHGRTLASLALICAASLAMFFRPDLGTVEYVLRIAIYLLLMIVVFARIMWSNLSLGRAETQARHRADHDELTGLLGRSAFRAALLDRSQGRVQVLVLDVDAFKYVNDTWGEAVGDEMLSYLAETVRAVVGPGALVSRYAGDQIAVVTEDYDPQDLAERLRRAVWSVVVPVGTDTVQVSCSVGAASGPASESSTLLSEAEVALGESKARGRDRVSVMDAVLREQIGERSRLRQSLTRALARGELELWLQPIHCVGDDCDEIVPCGYEALLRWREPVRGIVPPDEFLALAETAGLMPEIGRWVLREACDQVSRVRAHLDPQAHVAVNLSARELADPGLSAYVESVLSGAGLPASALWIELTETSMVVEPERTRESIAGLRRAGVTIALDDFGTGYASLAHLHELECQVVKIDRSFVSGLDTVASARSIISAVVGIAGTLGMRVVAEGVETPDQAVALRHLGVDMVQGYLYGRPRPLAEILADRPTGAPLDLNIG